MPSCASCWPHGCRCCLFFVGHSKLGVLMKSYSIRSRLCGVAFLFALASIAAPVLAKTIDVGPQIDFFSANTRGFWFTAPTDFVITGLGMPTEVSSDPFDVAVLRLNVTPPFFSAET